MGTDRRIAIDPGERNIGVALFVGDDLKQALTYTDEHDRFYRNLVHWLSREGERQPVEIVIEEYRLYPDKAMQQGYSQLKTVEVIGVVRYLCSLASVPMIEQGASIKKPTFAIMKARGVEMKRGLDQHARDAIAHGYYRINHPPAVKAGDQEEEA